MQMRTSRVATMLLAACLLVGVPFHSGRPAARGQQRDKEDAAILRHRAALESARAIDVHNEIPGQSKIVFIAEEGATLKRGDVLVKLDSSGAEELIAQHQLEMIQARAKVQYAEAELLSIKVDGEAQVNLAAMSLELAKAEKERELGDGGALAVEQAAVASEIAIAKARLQTAQALLTRLAADPVRAEEIRLRMTEAREALKVAETRQRFLNGPQRKHLSLVRDLAIARGAAGLDRHKSHLNRSVAGAAAELMAQQAALDDARQRLDRGQELLRQFQIVAPQDGTVVYQNTSGRRVSAPELKAGAIVRERQFLLRLVDLDRLQLKLYVDEADLDRLRVGQPATIKIDAFPDRTSAGKVAAISAVAEPPSRAGFGSKQYGVIVSLDDPPPPAKLGLTALVEIQVGAKETE